ncbi:MAG TPA: DUF2334 domain-containing protein [Thermoanaerobaculales bacterium]|nr:DUF2334 domain-containing protein [Thermoanaerobaculales bacterium]HQL30218.1 DUF2334 domain-containing protein [Thermoanaerobaculales bacterium]
MIRWLVASIHDVAPQHLDAVARLRDLLHHLGVRRCCLAVVPHWHGEVPLSRFPGAVAGIARWVEENGDEVLLHGYHHLDDAPAACSSLVTRVRSSLLTNGEGEFLRLSATEVRRRLEMGFNELRQVGLRPRGLVAPAWLYGPGALAGIRSSAPLLWEDALALHHTDGHRVRSPVLAVSSRSRARLAASAAWTEILSRVARRWPVARVAVHPADLMSDAAMAVISRALRRLLPTHTPVTLSECARALWPSVVHTVPTATDVSSKP